MNRVRIGREGIVDGESYAPMIVGALEQQNVTLELKSDIVSSLSRLQSFTRGPNRLLPYEIYGMVTLDRRPKSKGEVPFRASGDAPLTSVADR